MVKWDWKQQLLHLPENLCSHMVTEPLLEAENMSKLITGNILPYPLIDSYEFACKFLNSFLDTLSHVSFNFELQPV